ncbi:MAG: hypothetical protein IPK67_19100 [Planctomycetes bacterium]|nr:hypothetical protein [Planctomycetota bacterium]
MASLAAGLVLAVGRSPLAARGRLFRGEDYGFQVVHTASVADLDPQHAFQGIRRVELHFEESGEPRTVELRERVSSNGQGQFALEALEVIQPQMSVGQYSVFLSLQSLRQGMNWRYRDFAIENLALFQQNYRFIDTGATGEVAGFPTQEFRVERIDGPARSTCSPWRPSPASCLPHASRMPRAS